MRPVLVALAAAGLAVPALAQEAAPTDATVSCADFAGMTADDRMTAISEVAADEHAVTEETAQAVLTVCAERPEVALADAVEQVGEE
jgi:hypothetical protein